MILRGYCGARGPRGFGPFHLKPKAHTKEEEVLSDKMKGIQTARMYCRGQPCPRQAKIMGEKAAMSPKDIHSRITKEIPSHRGIGGEAAPEKAVTSVLNAHN